MDQSEHRFPADDAMECDSSSRMKKKARAGEHEDMNHTALRDSIDSRVTRRESASAAAIPVVRSDEAAPTEGSAAAGADQVGSNKGSASASAIAAAAAAATLVENAGLAVDGQGPDPVAPVAPLRIRGRARPMRSTRLSLATERLRPHLFGQMMPVGKISRLWLAGHLVHLRQGEVHDLQGLDPHERILLLLPHTDGFRDIGTLINHAAAFLDENPAAH